MAATHVIEVEHSISSGLIKTLGLDGGGGGNGGKAASGGGGGGNGKLGQEIEKGNKTNKKGLGATLGIKFGIASLLKQSQVYTGFIGSMFQLFGALVDVILAPFLPILIPGIRLVASMIPIVSQYAQRIYEFLDATVMEFFRNLPIPDWIKDNVAQALSAILLGVVFLKFSGLWKPFTSLLDTFIGKPLWELISTMAGKVPAFLDNILIRAQLMAMDIIDALWPKLQPIIQPILDNIVKTLTLWGDFSSKVLSFILTPFKGLWRVLSEGLIQAGDGMLGRSLTALIRSAPIQALLNLAMTLGNHVSSLFTWLFKELPTTIGNLPVVKRIMAFISQKLGPGLMGKLFAKVGTKAGLKAIGTSLKALPVLGAVAEVGMGGWQAYEDYKKYGATAAGARLALTAATATAAFFDPTGITTAVASVGAHGAMSLAYDQMVGVKGDYATKYNQEQLAKEGWNKDMYIQVLGEEGDTKWIRYHKATKTQQDQSTVGIGMDRASQEG
jgi:hypothetical protein